MRCGSTMLIKMIRSRNKIRRQGRQAPETSVPHRSDNHAKTTLSSYERLYPSEAYSMIGTPESSDT